MARCRKRCLWCGDLFKLPSESTGTYVRHFCPPCATAIDITGSTPRHNGPTERGSDPDLDREEELTYDVTDALREGQRDLMLDPLHYRSTWQPPNHEVDPGSPSEMHAMNWRND